MSDLGSQEDINKVYTERNACVGMAYIMATALGYNVGVKVEDPQWPIIFIDLPTGQVSWHIPIGDLASYFPYGRIPAYSGEYDGHSTEEKYSRLALYADQAEQIASNAS